MSRDPQADGTRIRILDAALLLVTQRKGTSFKMEEVANSARISRQAVYLHFADRADLLIAMVRHLDEKRGLAKKIRTVMEAPTAIEAVKALVALQATDNPVLWPVARLWDATRHSDPDVERAWQDRLEERLQGCRQIVGRLNRERKLKNGLELSTAADLLWTFTSLRMWEDLVVERRWSASKYERHIAKLILESLIT